MHEDWRKVDGTVAIVEEFATRGGTGYTVSFGYKVDGAYYSGTFTTDQVYRKGDTISVLYNPGNPERNSLIEQEKIRHWVIGGLICVAALILVYVAVH